MEDLRKRGFEGINFFSGLAKAMFPFPLGIDTSIPQYQHKRWVVSAHLWKKLSWYKKAYYKLRSWIKRDYFICDGEADEKEINRAIKSLPKNPGGAVYLMEGDFLLATAVVLLTRTALIGNGKGTRLYTTTANINLIAVIGTAGTPKEGCLIAQMYLYGTGAGTGDGVAIDYADDGKILNVWIENNGDNGVSGAHTTRWLVAGVKTYRNGFGAGNRSGIVLGSGQNQWLIVHNILIEDNNAGIYITGGNDSLIAANLIVGNGTYPAYGMWMGGAPDDCVIVGNWVAFCRLAGLRLEGNYNTVVGNIFDTSSSGDGIFVNGGDYNTIVGNSCHYNSGYGIQVAAGSSENIVAVNHCQNNTTGSILDNGINTEMAHNKV